jgi:hypothetical protein
MKTLRTPPKDSMNTDHRRQLVSLLSQWCGKPLALEFQFGVCHISGLCLLVKVTESHLQLRFDRLATPGCDFVIHLDDEIETIAPRNFEEAVESILGRRLASLTMEERDAFLSNSVEEVIEVHFRQGARLIIGVIKGYVAERGPLH